MDIKKACNIFLENPLESKLPHELSTFKSRTSAYRKVLFNKLEETLGNVKLFLLEGDEIVTLKDLYEKHNLTIEELIFLFYDMTEKKIKEEKGKEGNINDLLKEQILISFRSNEDKVKNYLIKNLILQKQELSFVIFLEQIESLIKKDLIFISSLSDRLLIDEIQRDVLEMFTFFTYKNLVLKDNFIMGFNIDYNEKQKGDFAEPTGLFDEDILSFITIFYDIIKREVENDPVSRKLFLFELIVSFFLSKNFDRNRILEILEKDFHIPLEKCSKKLEIVFFDNYEKEFSAPLILKMGKTDLLKNSDVGGESKVNENVSVMTQRQWGTDISKLLLDVIIYYDIRYAVGVILYLTDLCNKNGIQIGKKGLQLKQLKIALQCLYNGCMPFVLNPNKDLNVLPFIDSVFKLHGIKYKIGDKVKGMSWCNLFSSPKTSIDELKGNYHCIKPVTRRIDFILSEKRLENIYDFLHSLKGMNRKLIQKGDDLWATGKYSSVSCKKIGVTEKTSHCRLCGGIFIRKTEGKKYLDRDTYLDLESEQRNNIFDQQKSKLYWLLHKKMNGLDFKINDNKIEYDLDSVKDEEFDSIKLCRECVFTMLDEIKFKALFFSEEKLNLDWEKTKENMASEIFFDRDYSNIDSENKSNLRVDSLGIPMPDSEEDDSNDSDSSTTSDEGIDSTSVFLRSNTGDEIGRELLSFQLTREWFSEFGIKGVNIAENLLKELPPLTIDELHKFYNEKYSTSTPEETKSYIKNILLRIMEIDDETINNIIENLERDRKENEIRLAVGTDGE